MERIVLKERILYYTGSLASGGAERQLINAAFVAKYY